MMLGLEIDEPIEGVVARLSQKGVRINGSITCEQPGNFVHLEDPDGNEIYLWEVNLSLLADLMVFLSCDKFANGNKTGARRVLFCEMCETS